MGRLTGLKHLLVGPVVVVVMAVVMLLALVGMLVYWLINAVTLLLLGDTLLSENSRPGYYLYWAQSNIQWAATGRGELEWTP